MHTVAHLSDPRFGRLESTLLPVLTVDIIAAKPDVVAVSGDLTRRARGHEFRQARDFLKTLPFPEVVMPGNQELPLYNVISRGLLGPHDPGRYRRIDAPVRETNAHNIMRIEHPRASIGCSTWDPEQGKFGISATERFRCGPDGWGAAPQQRDSVASS